MKFIKRHINEGLFKTPAQMAKQMAKDAEISDEEIVASVSKNAIETQMKGIIQNAVKQCPPVVPRTVCFTKGVGDDWDFERNEYILGSVDSVGKKIIGDVILGRFVTAGTNVSYTRSIGVMIPDYNMTPDEFRLRLTKKFFKALKDVLTKEMKTVAPSKRYMYKFIEEGYEFVVRSIVINYDNRLTFTVKNLEENTNNVDVPKLLTTYFTFNKIGNDGKLVYREREVGIEKEVSWTDAFKDDLREVIIHALKYKLLLSYNESLNIRDMFTKVSGIPDSSIDCQGIINDIDTALTNADNVDITDIKLSGEGVSINDMNAVTGQLTKEESKILSPYFIVSYTTANNPHENTLSVNGYCTKGYGACTVLWSKWIDRVGYQCFDCDFSAGFYPTHKISLNDFNNCAADLLKYNHDVWTEDFEYARKNKTGNKKVVPNIFKNIMKSGSASMKQNLIDNITGVVEGNYYLVSHWGNCNKYYPSLRNSIGYGSNTSDNPGVLSRGIYNIHIYTDRKTLFNNDMEKHLAEGTQIIQATYDQIISGAEADKMNAIYKRCLKRYKQYKDID